MHKILFGLMAAILIIGALIAIIGAAVGLFTNNSDMFCGAVLMLLVLLLLGVVLGLC